MDGPGKMLVDMKSAITQPESAVLDCSDLEATVYTGHVPDGVVEELPDLYGSLFSTAAWFRIVDRTEATGACILERPRHVLLFRHSDRAVVVLNKAFDISAADAERACRALFRAFPKARRVHIETKFPPGQLRLPKRVLHQSADMVIDLPMTVADYKASLGKQTRKHLRNYENRLRRSYGEITTTLLAPDPRDSDIVRRHISDFVAWNVARFRARGSVSSFESHPYKADELLALVQNGGVVLTTEIAGSVAAVEFIFFVSSDACVYAGSFDSRYAPEHLGLLSTLWAVYACIERGAERCHLLWGTALYKKVLGATPVTASRLSVYPSLPAKLAAINEAGEVARRVTARGATHLRRIYHRLRRTVRVALDTATKRVRPTAHTD